MREKGTNRKQKQKEVVNWINCQNDGEKQKLPYMKFNAFFFCLYL